MTINNEAVVAAGPAVIGEAMLAHYTNAIGRMAFDHDSGSLVGAIRFEGQIFPLFSADPVVRSDRQITDAPEDKVFSSRPVFYATVEGGYEAHDPDSVGSVALLAFLDGDAAPLVLPDYAGVEPSTQFALRQYVGLDSDKTSRSGILARYDDENNERLLVTNYQDAPYLIEVKGCGMPKGGFEPVMNRFFSRIIMGGLTPSEARKEYDNLVHAHTRMVTPIVPVAIGSLGSDDPELDPHVVLKLTPSTVRLSHIASLDLLPTSTPAERGFILNKLADIFLDKFTSDSMQDIFVSPASHLENYLLSDDIDISETDFEDWRVFGSDEIPFIHTQTAQFVGAREIIEHYFINFSRLTGYDESQDLEPFKEHVAERCAEAGIQVDMTDAATMIDVARALWDQWLITVDYGERQRRPQSPNAALEFFASNIDRSYEISDDLQDRPSASKLAKDLRPTLEEICADDPAVDDFLNLGRFIMGLPMHEDLSLSDRAYVLRDMCGQYQQYYYAARRSLDDHELDEHTLDMMGTYLCQFERELELAVRVYVGLHCYDKFLTSEINRRKRLLEMPGVVQARDQLDFTRALHSYRAERRRLTAAVMSPHPTGAIDYFWTHFADSVDVIARL